MNPKKFRSRRVLLIEDHELMAEATADFMRSKGLDVRIASTGLEALETAAVFHPEIVLCDMRLPDMPGTDVARALRATPGTKEAVIAMHTSMSDKDLGTLRQHVDPAVNMFLAKPITEEQLDTLISLLSQAKKHF